MINILVCDDDSDIVSALRIFLTAQGYGVVEADIPPFNSDTICVIDISYQLTRLFE